MDSNFSNFLNRDNSIFTDDIDEYSHKLKKIVSKSSFLVLGGAGSVGQSTVKEIFRLNPKKLHVVDISENNLVELVRDIRSDLGYIKGDFRTFAVDIGSLEYDRFIDSDGKYDYILNLSALKHVRSEKDPYTLMRMIKVNILNCDKVLDQSIKNQTKNFFCVSTDKASNPVNMMGASKKIMELLAINKSDKIKVTSARFANVLFSDGSLLHGFRQRILKSQPIVAPSDIKRYFISPRESGQLCLLSCVLGKNRDVFFPLLKENNQLQSFDKLAILFLKNIGHEPFICDSEEQARQLIKSNSLKNQWPCFFHKSDTSGEKPFEEFHTSKEKVNLSRFKNIGIIKNKSNIQNEKILLFKREILKLREQKNWSRIDMIDIFKSTINEFDHIDTGKFLDDKM